MAHEHEKLIKCPYCDHEWEDSWEFGEDEGTHNCGSCGKEFNVTRDIEVTYCTSKIDCADDEHEYMLDSHHVFKTRFLNGVWHDLPEDKWRYVRKDRCSNCDDVHYTDLSKDELEYQVSTTKTNQ